MIPEHGSREDFKRILFALTVNPDQQDIILQAVMDRHGLGAQALGRTGTGDPYHYATTFAFSLPRWFVDFEIYDLLKKVAKESYMWMYRYQLNPNPDPSWHHGIVTFFGMTPLGDNRKKYYDAPPKMKPVEKYVWEVAERLKRDAEAENRRALAERHGLLA